MVLCCPCTAAALARMIAHVTCSHAHKHRNVHVHTCMHMRTRSHARLYLQVIRHAWQQATEPGAEAAFEAGAAAAAARVSAGDDGIRSGPAPSTSRGGNRVAIPYPTDACCTLLYCLAILREHASPLNLLLCKQLAALHMQPSAPPAPSPSRSHRSQLQQQQPPSEAAPLPLQERPDFLKQAKQVRGGGLISCAARL